MKTNFSFLSNMSEHPIQKAVETTRDCLLDSFPVRPAFLATHFSFGALGMPGYVIKSAAAATKCNFSDWARNDSGISEADLHVKVIIHHARQFQRGVTMPALLAKLAKKHKKPISLTLEVAKTDRSLSLKEEANYDYHQLNIRLSEKFAIALSPEHLAHVYFGELYKASIKNQRPKALTDGQLDLPRCEAFGILINEINEFPEVQTFIDSIIEDSRELTDVKQKAWALLGTLQSALLYFCGSQEHGAQIAQTSGFACAFPLVSFNRNVEVPFGFALGGPVLEFDLSKVRGCFQDHLWTEEVEEHVFGADISKHERALETAVSSATGVDAHEIRRLSHILEREIACIVPFRGPQRRLHLLGLWLIYLISKLRGAKHEGKAVDFWLVAGEQSEFADDTDVRLEKHPLSVSQNGSRAQDLEFDVRKFCSSKDGEVILNEEVCNLIARRLEKEHYPWFSLGRHALFFDSSSDRLNPFGLAELRSASWNRLVLESFKVPKEQELTIPGCLVAFVDGVTGEAGLLVCQPEAKDGKKATVKRVLRHKGGKWHLASEDRQNALKALLERNIGWLKAGDDSAMISQMATMIADDPHAGGTLVFLNEKPSPVEFLRLGSPWEFDPFHQEDRIPLISHDGATLVWKEGDSVIMAYRQLLTPEINDQSAPILKLLQTRSLGNEPDFPLLGVGTRRWSAALTALRSNVPIVVVISTDGDITCWWAKGDSERELWYQSLTSDFHPSLPKCQEKNVLAKS